ncbi:Hpt domain-containing protein [Novipirellula sp.]|uniref:Hpt domain-containing protein n=1 Tax=Novipirellula sp. TaxID=2795430 RepID=UPI003565E449
MSTLSEAERTQFSDALERVGGDEEMFIELAEIVSEDAPGMLAELESQLQSDQLGEVAQTAHALKGLLSTFQTGPPVAQLQPFIDEARRGHTESATMMFRDLMPSLKYLVGQVQQLNHKY